MAARIWPGRPFPLGAHHDGEGVNFALFSETATRVELCLFDAPDGPERERLTLPERTDHVFHGFVPGLAPGQLYGFRVYGPNDPANGLRFNPNKLLVDPYARAIANAKREVMVLMTHNTDVSDSWEREGEDPNYFYALSVDGYQVAINVLIYAMTH